EHELKQALEEKSAETKVEFPNTAYYLPVSYGILGLKIDTLGGLNKMLDEAKRLLPPLPAEKLWLPYLGHALDAGMAALFADEIIEGIKYTRSPLPYLTEANPTNGSLWLGAANDVIMRERGIEFVDGTAPGFAACVGYCPTNEIAVKIARELQEKNLYVFLAAGTDGKSMAQQLHEEGVQLGWNTRLVPFGDDVTACIHALGFATRAALSFGGGKPGDYQKILNYNKNRVFAFVLALGPVDDEKHAQAAGAINFGFPTISETDIGQILPSGICMYEHVVSPVSYSTIVEKALEVRGCKVKITKVPIPVSYGPAFEGERVRKADMQVEFGGNITPAFEFATMVDLNRIIDGEIEVIGPDIDTVKTGSALPLAVWVEVAGRKMQPDFEPILERQIHHLLNGAEGIWHMGQRDIIWTRVSKAGFAKGLRLKHYGEILHAKLLSNYPAIVDKVKVTLITDLKEVERRIAIARNVYDERNRRLETMTDESVDTFYSCLLCQSFAPNHVCMITPERLGLCGAYNWLDGKAAFEIDETGPNQPVKKGVCLDAVRGVWKGVDDFVYANSHKTVSSFSAYSIMDNPMTSCGCFEVICAYVPECNGVMVVNREFQGETPVGMTFSALAGSVGGGQQTPGFMGCGKIFITSKKFLQAEGGCKRLIWMPKSLKELLAEDLKKRFEEQGVPDLFENIADETIATDAHAVLKYMEKIHHPALEMADLGTMVESRTSLIVKTESAREEPPKEELKIPPEESCNTPSEKEKGTKTIQNFLTSDVLKQLKDDIVKEIITELKASLSGENAESVIQSIKKKFNGEDVRLHEEIQKKENLEEKPSGGKVNIPTAAVRFGKVTSFSIRKDKCEVPIWKVKLGATRKEGGTRGKSYTLGGETCMPFHLWEGDMPNRPLMAMEVFDVISEKYPPVLRKLYGDYLQNPSEMAKICVEKYGAELISVRLEGTHPEKGNRSPEDAVKLIKDVLQAVDVPLIITGHSHFDKVNEVFKAVAQTFAGENLLLNWVEQDNYRTIAGSALAYGHTLVAQSPIDVNIGKQLNILLTNMDVKSEQIIMDPMTGAMGYGIEYTYSVMERIRLTALNGDKMLAAPMIVAPGQECAKIKELKATQEAFPAWGELDKRAALWELTTAVNLLYAGADLLIMYHPEAAMALKRTISKLMEGKE
ncbi:MAG: acetyl-CoA decarbonylase/synthase complex subunit alpha/beta, partial [Bacteroidota bacterium]